MNEKRRIKQIVLKSKPKLKSGETTNSTTDSSDEPSNSSTTDFLLASTKILNDLRKSRIFTDIDLECTGYGRFYSAHSVVLASSSGFFRSYFTMKFQEMDTTPQMKRSKSSLTGKEIIPIRRKLSLEIEPENLSALLDFMYTGSLILPMNTNQLKAMVISAHKLKIAKFASYVVDSLRSRLSISTHALLWDIAIDLDHRDLREEVIQFLANRFDQLIESGELLSMPFTRLKAVCQYLQTTSDSHDEILSAVLLWVKHDSKQRKNDLQSLLRYIDVDYLSSVYITVLVKHEPLIQNADHFWEILSTCHVERINQNNKTEYVPTTMKQTSVTEHIRVRSPFHNVSLPTTKSEISSVDSSRIHLSPKKTTITKLSNLQQIQQTLDDDALSPRSRRFLVKNKRYFYEAMNILDLQSEAMGDAGRGCDIKKNILIGSVKRTVSLTASSQNQKSKANTLTILGRSRNGNTLMQFLCLERKVWFTPEDPCEMFSSLDYMLPKKAACIVSGHLFFIVGGLLSDGKVIPTTVVYDYRTSTFSKRNNMKYARYNSGVAVLEGYLYIIGGLDERTPLSKVERNLMFVDKWEDVAAIPIAGEQIVSAVVDKQIYCVSICRVSCQQMCCYYYAPKSDQWTELKFLPSNMINESHLLMASHHGRLYTLLWRTLPEVSSSVIMHYYNKKLNEWQQIKYSGFSPKRDVVAVSPTRSALWVVDIEGVLYKFNVTKCLWDIFYKSLPVLTTPLYAGIICSVIENNSN